MVTVVIAGDGDLARMLAGHYRQAGAAVFAVTFGMELEAQAAAIAGPVDLVVIADGYEPVRGAVTGLDRTVLGSAMHRLTYLPFRLAALLKPRVAQANGRLVLISRADARMEVPDSEGRYLERPFRASAHALWRCLSVEWQDAGIAVGLIGLDAQVLPDMPELADAIAGNRSSAQPVEFAGVDGRILGW